MAATQIQSVNHRHEAIIDWLMAHPEVKNLQVLCDQLNVSRSWLSIVMNSDAFRTEYQRRRDEYNKLYADEVQSKLFEASSKALDRLIDALDDVDIDPRFALDAVDKCTNRLGFGPSKGAAPAVQINAAGVAVVDKDLLAQARQKMRQVIDVEPEAE